MNRPSTQGTMFSDRGAPWKKPPKLDPIFLTAPSVNLNITRPSTHASSRMNIKVPVVPPGVPPRRNFARANAFLQQACTPESSTSVLKIPSRRIAGKLQPDLPSTPRRGFTKVSGHLQSDTRRKLPPLDIEARSQSLPQQKQRARTKKNVGLTPESKFFEPRMHREHLNHLLSDTKMGRAELFSLFIRFKSLCWLSGTPGKIDKKVFRAGVSSLEFEDDVFVDRVFGLLDEDGSGFVEWDEFVNAVHALETGSAKDKLRFCFQVYDQDGNDTIERSELAGLFAASLMHGSNRVSELSETMKELIDDFVNGIYDRLDSDQNGNLDFDECWETIQRNNLTDVWEIFGRTLVT